jgi:hypothetical protein
MDQESLLRDLAEYGGRANRMMRFPQFGAWEFEAVEDVDAGSAQKEPAASQGQANGIGMLDIRAARGMGCGAGRRECEPYGGLLFQDRYGQAAQS